MGENSPVAGPASPLENIYRGASGVSSARVSPGSHRQSHLATSPTFRRSSALPHSSDDRSNRKTGSSPMAKRRRMASTNSGSSAHSPREWDRDGAREDRFYRPRNEMYPAASSMCQRSPGASQTRSRRDTDPRENHPAASSSECQGTSNQSRNPSGSGSSRYPSLIQPAGPLIQGFLGGPSSPANQGSHHSFGRYHGDPVPVSIPIYPGSSAPYGLPVPQSQAAPFPGPPPQQLPPCQNGGPAYMYGGPTPTYTPAIPVPSSRVPQPGPPHPSTYTQPPPPHNVGVPTSVAHPHGQSSRVQPMPMPMGVGFMPIGVPAPFMPPQQQQPSRPDDGRSAVFYAAAAAEYNRLAAAAYQMFHESMAPMMPVNPSHPGPSGLNQPGWPEPRMDLYMPAPRSQARSNPVPTSHMPGVVHFSAPGQMPPGQYSTRRFRSVQPTAAYPNLIMQILNTMLTNPSQIFSGLAHLDPSTVGAPNVDISSDQAAENYEALLSLAERLGEAKPRGLSKAQVDQLPCYKFSGYFEEGAQTNCVVCMNDFEARQQLRVLPCSHEFHARCVDKWLKSNRTCPICRGDASEFFAD